MDHSRNIGIWSADQQNVLANTSVAILGVGLGSNVAELLVRTGFTKLVIADGDTVSETNLNRQLFTSDDIGKKKTTALTERLKQINPNLELKVIDRYVETKDVGTVLEGVDIVVDTIDLSSVEVILRLHSTAAQKMIPVVFPINLGWKSIVTVFTPESQTLEEFMGLSSDVVGRAKANDFSFWAEFLGRYVPDYGKEQFQSFLEKAASMDDWCPAPQLGITVGLTSSLVVATCVKIALGLEVKAAPELSSIDLFLQ